MTQGMRMDFFLDGPFMPPRMKLDRETLGGLADMFGQMPGSGIGTGPGVIQDRFSPTMGRHRSNPLFNGHGGHMAPPPQSQFDLGVKPFMKTNQGQNQHFHNQNQSHPSQQQAQSKDMPPRFIKKGQLNADEVRAGGFATQQPHAVCPISLRPAHSFPVNKNQVPKLQPQISTMIPLSAQPPRTQTPPLGQVCIVLYCIVLYCIVFVTCTGLIGTATHVYPPVPAVLQTSFDLLICYLNV
ncbi:eukaryotic translation initiation factor 4 gamma 2-like [Alosa alosa]|uniref:eukaryotic translation initiation factor 4 gamma 2-like n=1 Tax=Alosa alosa TaxID=278164 RepID=UPI002015348D|nr:eukaryotic translation initiation factor 4 gamma 2-like [Alosa alosa]